MNHEKGPFVPRWVPRLQRNDDVDPDDATASNLTKPSNETTRRNEETVVKRGKVDPHRVKNEARTCPRCMSRMPYVRLVANVATWSPYPWGWKCKECPCVTVHDGNIDPKKNTPEDKKKESDREDIFAMVGMILGYKKKAEA